KFSGVRRGLRMAGRVLIGSRRSRVSDTARELAERALWLQARAWATRTDPDEAEAAFARLGDLVGSFDGRLYRSDPFAGAGTKRRAGVARRAGERLFWRRQAWVQEQLAAAEKDRARLERALQVTERLSARGSFALGLWLREDPQRMFTLRNWDEL